MFVSEISLWGAANILAGVVALGMIKKNKV